jgi:lysophospholipase L1-like esterase
MPSHNIIWDLVNGVLTAFDGSGNSYKGIQAATLSTDSAGNAVISATAGQGNPTPLARRKNQAAQLFTPIRQNIPLNRFPTTTVVTNAPTSAAANPVLTMASTAGISVGTVLEVTQSDGTLFRGQVTAVVANTSATLNGTSTATIASGATVTIWSTSYTTAHTISSPLAWPVVAPGSSTLDVPCGFEFFADQGGYGTILAGTINPDWNYVRNTDLTLSVAPTYCSTTIHKAFFVYDSAVEISIKGLASNILVKIDGQLISPTTWTIANDGSNSYLYIPFGTVGERRVDIYGSGSQVSGGGWRFGGVFTSQTGVVRPAPQRGPSCIVLGDSMAAGTGGTQGYIGSFASYMGEYLGWDNVTSSGLGGSGYLNGAVTHATRIVHDVIQWNPDVVVFTGGFNDYNSFTAAQIQAAASSLFAQVRVALPNAILIVCGCFFSGGVSKASSSNLYPTNNALAAAAAANGLPFINLLEMPFPASYTPLSGTLTSGVSAGAATFQCSSFFGPRQVVQIDGERVEVLSSTGSNPSTITVGTSVTAGAFVTGLGYTIQTIGTTDFTLIGATSNTVGLSFTATGPGTGTGTASIGHVSAAHAVGATVTQVGPSLWTGIGRVGTTTGYGNSDTWVAADGTHPTDAGHQGIGFQLAQQISLLGIF